MDPPPSARFLCGTQGTFPVVPCRDHPRRGTDGGRIAVSRQEQTVDANEGAADVAVLLADPDDPFAPPEAEPGATKRGRAADATPRKRRVVPPGKQRETRFNVRLLPAERARMTSAAAKAGFRNASSWARTSLLAACEKEPVAVASEAALVEVARLRRDLNSGVGSNFNQVTTHANAMAKGGQSADGEALLRSVEEARAALNLLRADLAVALAPRGR